MVYLSIASDLLPGSMEPYLHNNIGESADYLDTLL